MSNKIEEAKTLPELLDMLQELENQVADFVYAMRKGYRFPKDHVFATRLDGKLLIDIDLRKIKHRRKHEHPSQNH